MEGRKNTIQKIGLGDILFSIGSWRMKFLKFLDFFAGNVLAFVLPAQKRVSLDGRDVRSMLVIRPGGLGDAIFLLPVLRAIKQTYPQCQIDILGERRNIHGFLSQKDIYHQAFCYDNREEFKSVFKHQYDVVVDTEQWHFLSAIVSYRGKAKCRVGFGTSHRREKLFNQPVPYRLDGYELINFQNLFSKVFKLPHLEDINNSFHLNQELRHWASEQIPANSVTLFLGASIPLRRFTREQSIKIIRRLIYKQFPVVLLGGHDILRDVGLLMKEVAHPLVRNYVGKTTLEQTAALINRSRLFIGTDSGIMHLACAVGAPVIAAFGPGNLEKWRPQGKEHTIVSEYVSCSPCTRFGYTVPTCKGRFPCMRGLKMERIIDKLMDKL
ncbi:MAG TPA: hypothetical protein DD723_01955 [Candidatus Omnitrophica bacterium]|nr:MAG: hypothetical protein A2Z81_08990 [Omnitrophica WOR_2 bacterium GWA2_45_18]HBR14291.1 hypothetical protein [Candidatus Omnitrophota bacterium]